jgi:phosphoribosylanthranilate isomerase
MFRIKICGITTVEDAALAVEAGADAIGLNFYEQSPRCVTPARAGEIAAAVPEGVDLVGVFVNASLDEMATTADQLQLDLIQLHGDEPPDRVMELAGRKVIRAFRCRSKEFDPILKYLDTCEQLGHTPVAALVDAYEPGRYGGTGQTLDWSDVRRLGVLLGGMELVLAGGLNPSNVGGAVLQARPSAVDVASGVEASPGRKDPAMVRAFVHAARQALDGLTARP